MSKPNNLDDFWKRVDKRGPDECWLFQGSTTSSGYGQWRYGNKRPGAHRVAFSLSKGAIPEGLIVMHSCDNRPCCNPTHLSLGTQSDNMQDMVRKGRSTAGDNHPMIKIPDADLPLVKAAYFRDGATKSSVAKQFGVSRPTIFRIVSDERKTA